MIKKNILIHTALFLFSLFTLSAQQLLNSTTASKSFVLPGKVLCQVENTSYGYVLIDDSKNMKAFTNSGELLWEKYIGKTSTPFISVLNNDFVILISKNGNRLSLYNPTGKEIWSKDLEFSVIEKPFPGRDGRFFLRGSENISCFGLNGIQKWTLSLKNLNKIPIQEFEDGSLILFYDDFAEGISKGIRFSPFGEIMEAIEFSALITSAVSFETGLLTTFTDGTSALFSITNGKIKIKWTLKKEAENIPDNDFFIVSQQQNIIIYANNKESGIEISEIQPGNGFIKNTFLISNIKNPDFFKLTSNGLLIADKNNCAFYNLTGKELMRGVFNTKNNATNYLLYTSDNDLIVFCSDWSVNYFKISQSTGGKTKEVPVKNKTYDAFYKIDTSIYDNSMIPEISSTLLESLSALNDGNYGKQERIWIGQLLSACIAYQNILFTINSRKVNESSIFERDNASLEKLISLLPLFGTDTFTSFISYLIHYENNRTILNAALISINENGYDPYGKLLNNLYLLAKRVNMNDTTVPIEVCDAVYSICRFMGKPAFNKQGKEIITTFLYPKFNMKSKEYARETFKKISALEL